MGPPSAQNHLIGRIAASFKMADSCRRTMEQSRELELESRSRTYM